MHMADCPHNRKDARPLSGDALKHRADKEHARVLKLLCGAGLLVAAAEGGAREAGKRAVAPLARDVKAARRAVGALEVALLALLGRHV